MADTPDTSTLTLNVYKKGAMDTPVASGTDTDAKAIIKGIAAGTDVAAGDYVATHADPAGKLAESDPTDVPAFSVPKAKAPAPTNVVATPTNDGATITAGGAQQA